MMYAGDEEHSDEITSGPAAEEPPATHCDWCAELFADGEKRFKGYENQPTHKKCLRPALRAERQDRGFDDSGPAEREPFTNWPNGQGTYD